jgi:mono/diheme cytochrome c family protein
MGAGMRIRHLALAFSILLPSAALAADGKAIYDKNCASCHGADGKGNESKAKVLKLDATKLNLGREETAGLSRDDAKKIVVEGKGKMPKYGTKLSAEDVDAALDYAIGLAKAIRGK